MVRSEGSDGGEMLRVVLLVGLVLGIWLAHRLALWLESKGWLYYRHRHASRSALGKAFLEVQQLVDPGKQLVLEANGSNPKIHRTGTHDVRRQPSVGGHRPMRMVRGSSWLIW
jgi:hypothetical protein